MPFVAWTDQEDGQGLCQPPASLTGHFQHWPLTPGLQVSHLHPPAWLGASIGERPALPGHSPGPDPGRPQSRAVCEAPRGKRPGQGRGLALGKVAKVWGVVGGQGTVSGIVMGGPLHIPECTLSRAVPAQWGCGTTCGAAGLGQHRDGTLTEATEQLYQEVAERTGYNEGFYIHFLCFGGLFEAKGIGGCKENQEQKEEL